MSFTPLKLDAITFASIAVPATAVTTFGGISRAGIDGQPGFVTDEPAGHAAPTMGALASMKPRASFSTPQIDVAMVALTTWGIQLSARLYQKNSTGAAPASRAGTTNKYKSIAAGVAHWTQITLPQPRSGSVASCDITILAAYNGSVNPIVDNGTVALPAGALAGVNFFAAGPFYLNGALVEGVQSISIANQIRNEGEGDADSIFDTYVGGTVQQVLITVTTLSAINWATVLASGLAITDITFFARKWQDGGLVSFVANDTAEHVLFNSQNAVAAPVSSMADGQGLFLETFQICCVAEDEDTPPLTATPSSAIAAPL